jgi:hypothetical protein
MAPDLSKIYDDLFTWCKSERFAGWDPFDGLNSKIFQLTPMKYFALPRLAWLQMVKRAAGNPRPKLKIEKAINPKAIALFALGELARFRTTKDERHKENATNFLKTLTSLKIPISKSKIQNSSAGFGYNFDWQSRTLYAPEGTPAIVPTAFAARAYLEAYKLFETPEYLAAVQEISRFIINDLNRPFETSEEICFSYTPLDKSVIFNASLLAGETLAAVGLLTNNWECVDLAERSARFVLRCRHQNGSWDYGRKKRNAWVDNFHTAYVLLSLERLQTSIPKLKSETAEAVREGLDFWLDNFFRDDGAPRYYDRETYPIDIHSASAAIVALCEFKHADERCLPLARKVALWTVENMRDAEGFFYYQKRKAQVIKIPFIRWGQAWMLYAMACLMETEKA